MIARAARLAGTAALLAAAAAAGARHERHRAFGTRYWRARAELYLALYDGPRLITDQVDERARARHRRRRSQPTHP